MIGVIVMHHTGRLRYSLPREPLHGHSKRAAAVRALRQDRCEEEQGEGSIMGPVSIRMVPEQLNVVTSGI